MRTKNCNVVVVTCTYSVENNSQNQMCDCIGLQREKTTRKDSIRYEHPFVSKALTPKPNLLDQFLLA